MGPLPGTLPGITSNVKVQIGCPIFQEIYSLFNTLQGNNAILWFVNSVADRIVGIVEALEKHQNMLILLRRTVNIFANCPDLAALKNKKIKKIFVF